MKIKTHLTYVLLNCLLGITVFICSKKEISAQKNGNTREADVNPKIIKFLSITLGVSLDEVEFSPAKNAFIIKTHKYDFQEITEIYNSSNDYQSKYENN